MSDVKRDYINQVIKQVNFLPDRAGIRQELEEHIEDMLEFAPEMNEAEQDAYVREQMGDPVETGQALNREHHVVLGWFWWLTRWGMVAMIVLSLLPMLYIALIGIMSIFHIAEGYPSAFKKAAVIEIDESGQIDDVYFHVDELVKYEDGRMELHYRYFCNPFGKSAPSGVSLSKWIYDDLGNDVGTGGGMRSSGIVTHCSDDVANLDSQAQKIIIDYDYYGREFYLEIPLEWEVVE